MTRSLAGKLILAFVFVALIGTLVSTAVVGIQTIRRFDEFVSQYEPPGPPPDRPREDRPAIRRPPNFYRYPDGTPQRIFERGFRQVLLLGAGGAVLTGIGLALLLTFTLTRPLRELTDASRRLARGELGHQVTVRSADELGQLTDAFNQMSRDLARAEEVRQQMTADVAHELRTPLSILSGYTEALEDGKLEPNSEMFAVMHQQVIQLRHLVEDLRTLSLADAGKLTLNRRPVDPKALFERVFLGYAARAEKEGVTLTLDTPETLPAMTLDVERMTQVLNNLVANALRHTPAGGTVTLRARPGELAVVDTGEGIDPADLPHIFERFYRADQARQRTDGSSGLGLTIAKSIVKAHNGKIEARSGNGETVFRLTIND